MWVRNTIVSRAEVTGLGVHAVQHYIYSRAYYKAAETTTAVTAGAVAAVVTGGARRKQRSPLPTPTGHVGRINGKRVNVCI